MDDAYDAGAGAEERVEVTVLLLLGLGEQASARVRLAGGEVRAVPARMVAEGLGVPLDERLAGRAAVAVVRDGQLVGFEAPEL